MSDSPADSELARMQQLDEQFSHIWMVRTFLKHSEEAEEDDELREVHRLLYDVMLALGGSFNDQDAAGYFKQLAKKKARLRKATDLFLEIQPEVSDHTNFRMAAQSLQTAVNRILELADQPQ